MDSCDVIIVGGGPGGSSCAWRLREAGLDVVVFDRAVFPRDKVCAGWITPQVVESLRLDLDEYRAGRTLQPITGFRTSLLGSPGDVVTRYGRVVSYGIRRCEFDDYLLRRSKAKLLLGVRLSTVARERGQWMVGGVKAPMLVGAGGHFCPIARHLNPDHGLAPLVAAQEAEFRIDIADEAGWSVEHEVPELYFSRDLTGYGWCFRKQEHVNVGLGLVGARGLPEATDAFTRFLQRKGRIPSPAAWRPRGHAYLLADARGRRTVDDGVVLVGDAAGLAYAQSGEGIRPAVESGLMAASAILETSGRFTRDRLQPYADRLRERFSASSNRFAARLLPQSLAMPFLPWLFSRAWFSERFLLDRWFLRASEPPLA